MDLSINGRFFHFMSKVADCIILSILWILFCAPIVTAGAATAALYYCAVKVLRDDQGDTVKRFWQSFKTNFKQSTLITVLVLIILLAASAVGTVLYAQNHSLTNIYLGYLVLLAFGVGWLHYVFSYIAKFETSLGNILKNSLLICLANFPQSAVMMLFFAAVVITVILLLPRSLGAILFIPAVYMWLVSFMLERIYQKYIPNTKGDSNDA